MWLIATVATVFGVATVMSLKFERIITSPEVPNFYAIWNPTYRMMCTLSSNAANNVKLKTNRFILDVGAQNVTLGLERINATLLKNGKIYNIGYAGHLHQKGDIRFLVWQYEQQLGTHSIQVRREKNKNLLDVASTILDENFKPIDENLAIFLDYFLSNDFTVNTTENHLPALTIPLTDSRELIVYVPEMAIVLRFDANNINKLNIPLNSSAMVTILPAAHLIEITTLKWKIYVNDTDYAAQIQSVDSFANTSFERINNDWFLADNTMSMSASFGDAHALVPKISYNSSQKTIDLNLNQGYFKFGRYEIIYTAEQLLVNITYKLSNPTTWGEKVNVVFNTDIPNSIGPHQTHFNAEHYEDSYSWNLIDENFSVILSDNIWCIKTSGDDCDIQIESQIDESELSISFDDDDVATWEYYNGTNNPATTVELDGLAIVSHEALKFFGQNKSYAITVPRDGGLHVDVGNNLEEPSSCIKLAVKAERKKNN